MMVSPKAAKEAGDKFGQKPVCAGPYKFVERVQQDRIVVEKFPDYWNKDKVHIDRIVYLPIVDSTVRLANLKSGQLDLIERVLATDIKEMRANQRLKLATVTEIGYQGITINVGKGEPAKGPLGSDPRVRQALELSIDRDAINQVVFNGEYVVGNQWVSPENPYYQQKFPVPKRDVAQGQGAHPGGRRARRRSRSTSWCRNNPETRQVAEVHPGDGGGGRLRHEDPRRRVRDLAQGGRGRPLPGLHAELVGPPRPRRQPLRLPQDRRRRRTTAATRTRRSTPGSTRRAPRAPPPSARRSTRRSPSKLLNEGSLLYLFHRSWLIAHTAKLEGLKLLPDGLVRVVGLKLK